MKKTAFLIFGLIVFSGFANAQSAVEMLDKVSNHYQNANSYYIKFELLNSGSSKPETGELFATDRKYNVEVMGIRQMYDGKNLYTVSKEDREVTVSQPNEKSSDFLSPTIVLNNYKNNFKASFGKTETINGKKVQYLKLTPNSTSEVEHALVGVYTKDYTLQSFKEFYKDGSSRTITVKEYLENLIIPKALFKFDRLKYEKDGYIVTSI